jgi:membrane-bound ClpP family serine protease
MSIALIVILIVIGLALIVVEVIVLPGINVAGIAGLILIAGGVFFAYRIGSLAGNCTLAGASILFIVFLIYALRSKTWDRLSLHSEITGKVNVVDVSNIKVGDQGVTVSRLAPIGKVLIGGEIREGKSEFGLIDENREIVVIQVNQSNIIVQEVNQSSS